MRHTTGKLLYNYSSFFDGHMTTHLSSQWRDPRIIPARLDDLTPMDLHLDDRYLTRDLPRVRDSGLWYPLMVYRPDPVWWENVWKKTRGDTIHHNEATLHPDGSIWAIKMGCNRWQAAKDLHYTSIDVILCESSDEAVRLGRWYAQCDPLHNPNGLPYQGLFDYLHLIESA